jgi:DNA-binding NarL/FixJ family response regulator
MPTKLQFKVPIKILIVEDHEWARLGLKLSIEMKSSHQVIAQAENGHKAIELVKQEQPDIVLMDIGMPVMDGIQTTRFIKNDYPNSKVIMLTNRQTECDISASLNAGANAYCLKDIQIERLIQVMEMVHEGARWFDPSINDIMSRILLNQFSTKENRLLDSQRFSNSQTGLSERQLGILKLIVQGKSNKEISTELSISIHTVKIHVRNIIQKLCVDDRTQAAIKALQENIVK